MKIIASEGMQIWYRPNGDQHNAPVEFGMLTGLNGTHSVNLQVFDRYGGVRTLTGVPYWDGEGEKPSVPYALAKLAPDDAGEERALRDHHTRVYDEAVRKNLMKAQAHGADQSTSQDKAP